MNSHKEELDAINIGGTTVAYNQGKPTQSPTHRLNATYDDAFNKFKKELPDNVSKWRNKANAKPQMDTKGKITFKQLMDRLNKQFNPKKVGGK